MLLKKLQKTLAVVLVKVEEGAGMDWFDTTSPTCFRYEEGVGAMGCLRFSLVYVFR